MIPYDPPRLSDLLSTRALLVLAFGLLVAGGLLLPLLALGQEAPMLDPDSIEQLLGVALQALALPGATKWVVLSLLAVLFGVWLVRRLARNRTGKAWLWIASDEGGTVLKWVAAAIVAVVTRALAGAPLASWETAAVALGLSAGASLRTDWRRLLRAVTPVVALIPKVGEPLAALLGVLSGATAKAEIAAATARTYAPLSPAPTAQQAADELSRPPVS